MTARPRRCGAAALVALALVAALAARASAGADGPALPPNMSASGHAGFAEEVEQALDRIGKTKTGQALFACIKNDRHLNVRIQQYGYSADHQEPQATPNIASAEVDGQGTSSEVRWDPDTTVHTDGIDAAPDEVLVHELAHACDQLQGTVLGTNGSAGVTVATAPDCGVTASEALASAVENAHRKEAGLGPRATYGGKSLKDCPPPLAITAITAITATFVQKEFATHYTVTASGLWTEHPNGSEGKRETGARALPASWRLALAPVDLPQGTPGPAVDAGCDNNGSGVAKPFLEELPGKGKSPFSTTFTWVHPSPGIIKPYACDHAKQGPSGHQGIVTVTVTAGVIWRCTATLGGTESFDPVRSEKGARKSSGPECGLATPGK